MIDKLRKVAEKKGHAIFENSVNLWFERNSDPVKNRYDDTLHLFIPAKNYHKEIAVTTEPGAYWLKNPMNGKGCAILKPGQYRGMWKVGKHRGKYMALVQAGPCTVFRDNNKDDIIDDYLPEDAGHFGINYHHGGYDESDQINKDSAGCQVARFIAQYLDSMSVIINDVTKFGNSFTCTLIESKDLE
jgi:hypothetical protein